MKLSGITSIAILTHVIIDPFSFVQGFESDDVAEEEDWDKFTHKGGALMCGLTGDDQTAGHLLKDKRNPPSAASVWTGDLKPELEIWYWRQVSVSPHSCELKNYWNIPFAMRSLGLNADPVEAGGDNQCSRVEHWDPDKQDNGHQVNAFSQMYGVGGKEYRATGAYFEFGINTKGGAIFCFYLEGPMSAASSLWYQNRKAPDPNDLPQLRALSDILWGYWNRDNSDIKNIRYFMVLGIANEKTNQLIASCLERVGKELEEWPGTSFSTTTDEGHALLGSPNGATFAYFLMQRKAELGNKIISKVTVFRKETDDDMIFVDPCLVFHVEDAPEVPAHGDGSVLGQMKRDKQREGIVRDHKL